MGKTGLALAFGLILTALSLSAPGLQAADLSVNAAVSRSYESSWAYDLYLKASFEPFARFGSAWEASPQAYVGLGVWHKSGDYIPPPQERRGQNWSKRNFSVYGAVGLELAYAGDSFRPYIAGFVGPSYVDEIDFLGRELGSHILIHARGNLGFGFGENFRHRLSLEYTHYSNAGTNAQNDGLDNYGLSYSFRF